MAFEKQMRNLYGYDIWMDWEKPRLGTTIAVFEGPDNVQILYWTDPSELTKEEALAETKALYPDREVVFHDKIDAHQAMVPRIVKEGGGIVEVPAPNSDRNYGRRELVVIGGNQYYSYKGISDPHIGINTGDIFKVADISNMIRDYDGDAMLLREEKDKPVLDRTRGGKSLKHWQR